MSRFRYALLTTICSPQKSIRQSKYNQVSLDQRDIKRWLILQDEDLDILVAAIQAKSNDILESWMSNSAFWTTVKAMAGSQPEAGPSSGAARGGHGSTSWSATNGHHPQSPPVQSNEWNCPHCTFVNNGPRDACEVCGLPSNTA